MTYKLLIHNFELFKFFKHKFELFELFREALFILETFAPKMSQHLSLTSVFSSLKGGVGVDYFCFSLILLTFCEYVIYLGNICIENIRMDIRFPG